jgi:hypothetical protein
MSVQCPPLTHPNPSLAKDYVAIYRQYVAHAASCEA